MRTRNAKRLVLRSLVLCTALGLSAVSVQAKPTLQPKVVTPCKTACVAPVPMGLWGGLLCAATVGLIAARRKSHLA